MSSDRWRKVEEVYHAAMERPLAERSAFVAGACRGDDALEREIRSLLEQPSAPGFLSAPAMEVAAELVDDDAHWKGRRIGVYTLDALLGRGGMGEVYRARDNRLGRDVAIKVLPKAFTAHPDRLARFEREARLLAALNHPHIGTIHGVEEDAGTLALVLELVEGDTLADRIANGPLPVREALPIARQIADALDAAHEKGIVHRDLKPANVKITPQGVVKVLDFGLAKTDAASSSDMAHSPTVTGIGTVEGVILGTAAYMSPEQARGHPVDKRADVWAFGCVLYELLTGRAAFAESTSSDTIAAILKRDPDWAALPPALPPAVTKLLHRCLEKDLHRRKRELGDARAELDDAIAWRPTPEIQPPDDAVAPSKRRAVVPWSIATAALVLAAAMAAVAFWPRWQSPLDNAQSLFIRSTPIRLTNFPGAENDAVISPNGQLVAFLSDHTGQNRVYLSQTETGSPEDITPPGDTYERHLGIGVRRIAFTADSSQISLNGSTTQKVRTLPIIGGGPPRQLIGPNVHNAAWSPDGTQIVYNMSNSGDPLFLADSSGANPVQIYQASEGQHNHGPVWGVDGEWIYFIHGYPNTGALNVWRIRASRTLQTPEALTHNALDVASLAPLDARTLLYVARADDGSGPWLWALDVEAKTSRRLSSGLEQYTSISGSKDGRQFVASVANPRAGLWTVPILDRPAEEKEVQAYGPKSVRALAPRVNGKTLFYLSALGTGDGLWRFQDGQTTEIWRGSQGGLVEPAAVSPDGLRVAIVLRKGGRQQLAVTDVDGGVLRPLADSIDIRGAAAWSPEGKWLVVGGESPEGLFKVPVDGGPPIPLHSGFASNPAWSSRDDLIVFSGSSKAGRSPLLGVRPDGQKVVLKQVQMFGVSARPRFLPDGSGVVFAFNSDPGQGPDLWLLDLAKKTTRQLTALAGSETQGMIGVFDVTADGKLVFDRQTDNSDVLLIKLPR
jgi:serine/threonine protein kinase